MDQKSFTQSKESVLAREDMSSVGGWDEKIIPLCDKINADERFYTSSSCSGRIIIMIDQEKKGPGLFLLATHNESSFDEVRGKIDEVLASGEKRDIKFKTEAPIIHIVCNTIEAAQELCDKAKDSGFKKTGIISFKRKIVLEINSGEKIEFPLIKDGKVLVDDEFLKLVILDSNRKLSIGWEKLGRLLEKL